MSDQTPDPKSILRRIYTDVWNRGDLSAAAEIFARPEGVQRYVQAFREAFPDIQHTVVELAAEGDTVFARWTARGAHTGHWHSLAPTGRIVTYTGITVAHLSGGKIADHFTQWDTLGLLEQLGVVPLIRKADGSRL